MAQSIISKGRDINEAISVGLSILNTTINDVNIEVIQNEKKGFLKIGKKTAVVKLTKRENTFNASTNSSINHQDFIEQAAAREVTSENIIDEFEMMEKLISQLDIDEDGSIKEDSLSETPIKETSVPATNNNGMGKAWVENGLLQCNSSSTHYPVITVPKGINVYKNKERVTSSSLIITQEDDIQIELAEEKIETKWNISMDKNHLKVMLNVFPGCKITRTLADVGPSEHLKLVIEEEKIVDNSLTYEDIIKELDQLRVKYGFNHNEIMKAIETVEKGEFEIATGLEPKPGKNGWVEVLVKLETESGLKEKEDGSIDFKEINDIPAIAEGQVIGVVYDPVPGVPGVTVQNDPLPAKQTFPVVLQLDKGVERVGDQIISLQAGRPKVEKRGLFVKVSVLPKLTHKANVDLESGNIRFRGDVEVLGKIEEGMLVEATGDITIRKEVNRSKILAAGAITSYGNIMSSELSAGKSNMIITELGDHLAKINMNLKMILKLIEQLTQSPAFKNTDFNRRGLKPLIIILLEKKFRGFPGLVKTFNEKVTKHKKEIADKRFLDVSSQLNQCFLSLNRENVTHEYILNLSKEIHQLYEMSQTPVEPEAFITIPSAVNSQLYCSGDITIHGKGSVHSKIYTGGKLKIRGIIRGGEVFGRHGVQINEVGSDMGAVTKIAVPRDQKIRIDKAMDGTTIKIGNVAHTFSETTHFVNAYLNEEQKMVLH
ncbi:FapA family protein [Alkalihalophilus pseudofirmus]|uniref:FapA family protein n=1 Tax=Alkalihalophilus pseudofirmus TaxID=79885 RepID=A0AAJ2KSH4_ALKPS|nr:FapA family protein [Alkalihalophilus pseudofirmus]MDV2883869.1 FapA family protein [Alkalihalophilus pseudofirmus]